MAETRVQERRPICGSDCFGTSPFLAQNIQTTEEDGFVKIDDLDPALATQMAKTQEQIRRIGSHQPSAFSTLFGDSLKGRVSEGCPEVRNAEEVSDLIQSGSNDPNLAAEALKLALKIEARNNGLIKDEVQKARESQKSIDLLLDLNAELSASKDKLSPKAKEILEKLKKEGVDIWKHKDDSLSKEKIADCKQQINSRIDELRFKINFALNQNIQPIMQALSATIEAIKRIIEQLVRHIERILQKMAQR